MSRLFFQILILTISFCLFQARVSSRFRTLTKTGAFSSATKVLSQYGVNQGWPTFNQKPRILADINGDGLKDIVGFDSSNQLIAFADGNGGFSAPFVVGAGLGGSSWNFNNFPVTACDVNGDGLEDLVGFGYSYVFVALSKQTTLNFAKQVSSGLTYDKGWSTYDRNPRFCYDVDGDGKADLVGFADDGVYVEFSNGASFAPKKLVLSDMSYNSGWTSFNLYPRCLGKINNGCGADIIGFYKDGVRVATFNGETFNAPTLMLAGQYGTSAGGWYSQQQYPRLCVDMNGDGKTDIVAFGGNSFITYAKSDGTFGASTYQVGESTSQMTGFSSYDITPRAAGRLRSSTVLGSLIGFKADGVYVAHKTS